MYGDSRGSADGPPGVGEKRILFRFFCGDEINFFDQLEVLMFLCSERLITYLESLMKFNEVFNVL